MITEFHIPSRKTLIIGAVVATITLAKNQWVTEYRIHSGGTGDWTKHPTWGLFNEAISAAMSDKPIPEVEDIRGALAVLQQKKHARVF